MQTRNVTSQFHNVADFIPAPSAAHAACLGSRNDTVENESFCHG